MKLMLFAIYDKEAKSFGPPLAFQHVVDAQRHIQRLVNDERSGVIYRHTKDFDLYIIGDYETDTANIIHTGPGMSFTCIELKDKDEKHLPGDNQLDLVSKAGLKNGRIRDEKKRG